MRVKNDGTETLLANCLPHRKCSIFYEQLLMGDLGRGLVWPVSRAGSGAGQLYHLLLPSQILQSVLRHDFMNYSALSVEGGDQALSSCSVFLDEDCLLYGHTASFPCACRELRENPRETLIPTCWMERLRLKLLMRFWPSWGYRHRAGALCSRLLGECLLPPGLRSSWQTRCLGAWAWAGRVPCPTLASGGYPV